MVSVGPYAAYLRDASQTATIKAVNPNQATTTNNRADGKGLFIVYNTTFDSGPTNIFHIDGDSPVDGTRFADAACPAVASGPVAVDSSGHSYHGTYANPAQIAFGVSGIVASQNNGSVACLTAGISVPVVFDYANPFTVEFWVVGNQWIFAIGQSVGPDLQMFQDPGPGHQYIIVDSATTNGASASGSYPYPDHAIHHIVLRATGSTLEIWEDGAQVMSAPSFGTGISSSVTTVDLKAINFIVQFDEFALYDYALSPAQIANHHTVGVGFSFNNYVSAVLTDTPQQYYHLDDVGPFNIVYGTAHVIGDKLVVSTAFLHGYHTPSSSIPNSWGLTHFDLPKLTNPTYHPFTDVTSNTAAAFHGNFSDSESFGYQLRYYTDGTYAYIRQYPQINKYAVTGGNALGFFNQDHVAGLPSGNVLAETWQFDADGKHIYMAGEGYITPIGELSTWVSQVDYGLLGHPLTTWLDFSNLPGSHGEGTTGADMRSFCGIDAISVDPVTRHVFLFWDNFQSSFGHPWQAIPIFIDEHLPDGTFVDRWIPRTSLAPAPVPENGWPGGQGVTMCPAMDVKNGILYVNFDLYWGTAGKLEDAVWKINTNPGANRAGESEFFTRALRSPAEQAATDTISPIQSICVGGRFQGGTNTLGPQVPTLQVREPV